MCFFLCSFAAASLRVAAEDQMPVLKVDSLSGKEFTLPSDLAVGPSLFIIGFSKASRDQTEEWSRRLRTDFPADELSFYNVSILEDAPRFLRPMILRGIKKSVPESHHERFLVVKKQSQEWKKLASYGEPDIAYLVLLNNSHQVIWRFQGPANDSSVQELKKQLESEGRDEIIEPSIANDAPASP